MTGISTEEREHALSHCSDALHAAADTMSQRGRVEAATVVRELAECEDLHQTAARNLVDLEALDEGDRDLVINGVYDVARVMIAAGDDWNPGVLVEWLEQVTKIYGFPGERQ